MVNADLYLQGHRFEYDHCAWLLEGQMVKSVYGLFFHNILVAKGGPEAEEDPLCVDCALAIRDGSRDLSAGIPALEGGRCPDCGGTAGFDPHLKQLLPGSQRVWPVNEPYPYLP